MRRSTASGARIVEEKIRTSEKSIYLFSTLKYYVIMIWFCKVSYRSSAKAIKFVQNKLADQFTSADIWKMLPIEVRDSIAITRVTDTISREAIRNVIVFTGQKHGK